MANQRKGDNHCMSAQNSLSETFYEHQVFYGTSAQMIAKEDGCSVFKMENETGEGIMTCYPIFPGIELIYNDMHISAVRKNQGKPPCLNVMEINHCREGRFECEFSDGARPILARAIWRSIC